MFIIKPHQTAVSLFHKDGTVRTFPSMARALAALGYRWICNNVGKNFRVFSHISNLDGRVEERKPLYSEHDYIMRNDVGEALTAVDFHSPSAKSRSYSSRMYQFWNGTGPVPHTRKRRGGNRNRYFRHPKTMAERRDSYPIFEDGEIAPRPARTAILLPTAWDDNSRSDYGIRSWKKHRKTQWFQSTP